MLSTLVLVLLAWALTVPAVLGLARLLGRVSAPPERAVAAPPEAPENVVALVPRPQNALVPARAGELRRAS